MNRHLISLALAGLAFPALAATPINETRPLDARGEVEVSNLKGSIELRTWDRDEVRITGSLGEGVERLEIGDGGAKLVVRAGYPRTPRHASRAVDSVAPSVDVQGVAGAELEIETVSGDVVAVGAPRKANIDSVSGDLKLTLNSRDVDIESVSGRVSLRGRIAGSI